MSKFNEMLKIADIHAKRIIDSMNALSDIFPISADKLDNLSQEEFLFIELLTNRFSKLQGFIGAKLIDEFFKAKGEVINNFTMIDKLNKLEKLRIIDDKDMWFQMREARNHLSHEYPDHPEIISAHLNQVFLLSPQLISLLNNLKR